MLLVFISCKHEPEDIVIIDPIPPGDTIPTGLTCDPDTVYFQNEVLPLLISGCGMSGCHDASTAQEGVILTSYQSVMNTAEIIPGNPGRSELYEAITEDDPEDRMPPSPMAALSTDQILLIRKWIEQGAKNNYCDAGCDTNSYTYANAIQPLLDQNCKGCHNATLSSGGIRLDNYASVKSAAVNGSLYGAINHQQGYTAMPQGGNKLADCNIIQVRKWIADGAPNN
ncbi:MAG: c-type cytochrome domain-containing protein [Bacteroidota bacterium]